MSHSTHQAFGIEYQFPLSNEKLMELACAESIATSKALKSVEEEVMSTIHDFKGRSPKGYFNQYIKKATIDVHATRAELLTKISLNHSLGESDAITKDYLEHVQAYNMKATKPLFAIINDGKPRYVSNMPCALKISLALCFATMLSSYFN